MMKIASYLAWLVITFGCSTVFGQKQSESHFHLKLVRTLELSKSSGNVDQLIPLPDGGFLIRDSSSTPLQSQAVEVYGPTGNLVRKIGSFGQQAGQYYALKELAFSARRNMVWVVDMYGRVSRFDLSGKFLDSTLIQKPGFHPYGIALNEELDHYYLTGCVALRFYLDLGCKMVHEYEMTTHKYIRSFAENAPEAVKRKYFSIEDYQVSVGPSGLYAIDAPIRKFWKILPDEKMEAFQVAGKALGAEIPDIDPRKPAPELAKGQYLFETIVADSRAVVISAGMKGSPKYLLEVFSPSGKPIALDVSAPGRLLGKSRHGTLWFGERRGAKFQLAEYSY